MKLIKSAKILYTLKNSACQYKEPQIQNKFDKTKLSGTYDNIIIGSGPSGLMCASLLSKLGKKCILLDQHDRAGGGIHTFTVKGFTFDVGYQVVSFFRASHRPPLLVHASSAALGGGPPLAGCPPLIHCPRLIRCPPLAGCPPLIRCPPLAGCLR